MELIKLTPGANEQPINIKVQSVFFLAAFSIAVRLKQYSLCGSVSCLSIAPWLREKTSGEERHLSFVIISGCLQHDTIAVFQFQSSLLSFLKETLPCKPKKIIYFSDGAASQYKNRKNFLNLCHHENDFGVKAEWHFSATSHGKGACDGVGGTVKRLAAKASLQKPFDNQVC